MTETVTVRGDNLTLDLLLWRRHGVRGVEVVEQTMALNPGLTSAYLPVGAVVDLPDLPVQEPDTAPVVTLFG
ncbi:MAG: tail protein X [Pseudomonadota bacterium]